MTDIIDHGEWVVYQPTDYPVKGLPPNIIFAKRVSDGADWYQFQRSKLTGTDSVKMTVMKQGDHSVVMATTHDASTLFPANMRVIEIRDLEGDHEAYRQKAFDINAKTFRERVRPPRRLSKLEQAMADALGWDEKKISELLKE